MNIIYSCAAVALFASPAIAGIKIPRSVISYTEIDKAAEKAKDEDKALAFVFTDKGTN